MPWPQKIQYICKLNIDYGRPFAFFRTNFKHASNQFIVAKQCHMVLYIYVNIGSGNG